MEFSRQEYWSGLPFPFPGDLPDTGMEPRSPTLQADALPSEPPGRFSVKCVCVCVCVCEYYSAIRKEILPFVTTWMEPEGIMLSE